MDNRSFRWRFHASGFLDGVSDFVIENSPSVLPGQRVRPVFALSEANEHRRCLDGAITGIIENQIFIGDAGAGNAGDAHVDCHNPVEREGLKIVTFDSRHDVLQARIEKVLVADAELAPVFDPADFEILDDF